MRLPLAPILSMRITDLQNEANHLLFLYFTSVGVIQRDAGTAGVHDRMDELRREISECRGRILGLLDGCEADVELCADYRQVAASGREFVCDGTSFLDRVLGWGSVD